MKIITEFQHTTTSHANELYYKMLIIYEIYIKVNLAMYMFCMIHIEAIFIRLKYLCEYSPAKIFPL